MSFFKDTMVERGLMLEDEFEHSEETRPALCRNMWKNLG